MKRDLLRAAGLALVVSSLWCHAYGRTNEKAWRVPIEYYGDSWAVLAQLRAAADGHFAPLRLIHVPELGAPTGADWNGFLHQHTLQYWLAGRLAQAIGLFPTANLLPLLASVLAAVSFYAVTRYFRARPEWALAGALAFSLSPFLFFRSLSHLSLTFFWPVPLAILVVTWAFARRPLSVRSRRFAAAAAIALVMGQHNIYFAGMLAQFLVLAGMVQATRARRIAPVWPLLALLLLLSASVLADAFSVLAFAWRGGATDAMARPYGNLERYALKPIELLLPIFTPGLAPWAPLGVTYFRGAIYRGEMGGAYLGLAGVAALAWVCATAAASYVRRPRGFPPAAFLALAWILAFSVVGGLNGVLGTLGVVWFRATSRYSVWIQALVLMWAVIRLSRMPLARRRGASLVALGVGLLVVTDQLPSRRSAREIAQITETVASDRTLVRSLEATLPAGAMLFQLPVVGYPEGARNYQATDYEHLRPYLQSSRLRFSYGAEKGSLDSAWQSRAEALPPVSLAETLERIGFSGLLVNRKGFVDGASELREELAASGRQEAWESPDRHFLFVRLNAASKPSAPDDVIPPTTDTGAAPP